MNNLILIKIFLVLNIMPALSCSNIMLRSGNFGVFKEEYGATSDELSAKRRDAAYANISSPTLEPGISLVSERVHSSSVINNVLPGLKVENSNVATVSKRRKAIAINYAGTRRTSLKVQPWIICKSQFIRVRPEVSIR